MGNEIKDFVLLITQKIKENIPIQTVWTICKEVNWENKTMTATGQLDNLDYQDVLLGKGFEYKKPKVGCLCLIGVIQNNDSVSFLIDAEIVEEYLIEDSTGFKYHLKDGELTMNGDGYGGLVNSKELKMQLDKNTAILNAIKQTFATWVPSPNDGGAALKSISSTFTSLESGEFSNIENQKIKHGG